MDYPLHMGNQKKERKNKIQVWGGSSVSKSGFVSKPEDLTLNPQGSWKKLGMALYDL